ncbi:uncharacterized protein L3040_007622 [Drepanopeziza brunnea f. sp. 'multigermtubi']|uniref:uncharacterized protein n=1 Tax=Drepanopeziza brunnea f. sp. 'multigermtubi' TaxID=698441 RepID=UPI00238EE98E|nr:hypothetical protein L3040_007622 [Drepanopeziza brunnea f. sp. 'multigermtubi']
MFKWHGNAAFGRARPAAYDLARVADGIAESLRQFSISASRYAEEDGNADALRVNRSSRSADASRELSSLPLTPSRGIDARSLAAPAPFRRVDDGNAPLRGRPAGFVSRPRGDFRGGGMRGGARGGARGGMRGRGGARGGAQARGQGNRGRGKGPKREKANRPKEDDDRAPVPYTAEEIEYIDNSKGGFQKPYQPVTSAQDLARWGPPVISSPRGVVETLRWKMAAATDNQNPEYKTGALHHLRTMKGVGTIFESAEERAKAKKALGKLESLSKQDQEAMMKQWAGGQYVTPKPVQEPGDVLALVATYTRRNETYLPEDARKFEQKLRSLLPATVPKPPPPSIERPL